MISEKVTFIPEVRTVGQMDHFTTNQVRDEPMLFSCDIMTSRKLAGPIGNMLLDIAERNGFFDNVPEDLHLVFDSRVTLTMPGMYPSIPGWHCDDFNRDTSANRFSQPKIADRDKRIKHLMTIVPENNQDVSATEFITNSNFTIELDTKNVWHSLDKHINSNKEFFKTQKIKGSEVITFSQDSVHRATPTINGGWRYFGRISHTYRKPANELRKQVQVFVDINNNGW